MKETQKKLFAAYVGESQARARYSYFSSIAKKEGYVLISRIFQETAEQEKEHGLNFYKMFQKFKDKDEPFNVCEDYPST